MLTLHAIFIASCGGQVEAIDSYKIRLTVRISETSNLTVMYSTRQKDLPLCGESELTETKEDFSLHEANKMS